MKKQNHQLSPALIILGFIAGAGILRLLLTGNVPNITPIAAMALFGGAYFQNKKLAFVLPLFVMFLTDMALEAAYQFGWREYSGFHSTMPFVYMGFLFTVLLGTFLKSDNVRALPLAGAGLLSSAVFFIVTNFGVWATAGYYPTTLDGLITCYVAAIPFFHYSVIGDLFFIALLFGGFAYLKSKYLSPAAAV